MGQRSDKIQGSFRVGKGLSLYKRVPGWIPNRAMERFFSGAPRSRLLQLHSPCWVPRWVPLLRSVIHPPLKNKKKPTLRCLPLGHPPPPPPPRNCEPTHHSCCKRLEAMPSLWQPSPAASHFMHAISYSWKRSREPRDRGGVVQPPPPTHTQWCLIKHQGAMLPQPQ